MVLELNDKTGSINSVFQVYWLSSITLSLYIWVKNLILGQSIGGLGG